MGFEKSVLGESVYRQDINFLPKVQLFREGHKTLCHPPYGFDIYLVNFKTIKRMTQIFVAFSEKLNFSRINFKHLT